MKSGSGVELRLEIRTLKGEATMAVAVHSAGQPERLRSSHTTSSFHVCDGAIALASVLCKW